MKIRISPDWIDSINHLVTSWEQTSFQSNYQRIHYSPVKDVTPGISWISNHVKALPAAPVAKFIAFLPDTQVATEMVTPDQQPRGS